MKLAPMSYHYVRYPIEKFLDKVEQFFQCFSGDTHEDFGNGENKHGNNDFGQHRKDVRPDRNDQPP